MIVYFQHFDSLAISRHFDQATPTFLFFTLQYCIGWWIFTERVITVKFIFLSRIFLIAIFDIAVS